MKKKESKKGVEENIKPLSASCFISKETEYTRKNQEASFTSCIIEEGYKKDKAEEIK